MTTINTPTGWNDNLKSMLECLTNEQKDRLFEMLKQDKKDRGNIGNESLKVKNLSLFFHIFNRYFYLLNLL